SVPRSSTPRRRERRRRFVPVGRGPGGRARRAARRCRRQVSAGLSSARLSSPFPWLPRGATSVRPVDRLALLGNPPTLQPSVSLYDRPARMGRRRPLTRVRRRPFRCADRDLLAPHSKRRIAMRGARFITLLASLLSALSVPVRASAQTATGDESAVSAWGAAAIVAVVLIMMLALGAAIKLYDLKRKRDDEALSAQSYLSEALLREFGSLPITASVSGSSWRRPFVIAIRGSVSTTELREAIMRGAARELSRQYPTARVEDQLFVDPLIGKEHAATVSSRG